MPSFPSKRDRPLTYGGLVRTHRFSYELGDLIAGLKKRAQINTQDVKDWIIEELRDYCLLDVSRYVEDHPPHSGIHPLDAANNRFVKAVHKSLYRLFLPMSVCAHQADFVDVLFPKDVLMVTLYDLAQY